MSRLPFTSWRFVSTLIGLLALAGCQAAAPNASGGPVVLAAASLQDSLEEVAAVWSRAGHAAPKLAFAATSTLARQIQQGAPADVFVSADEDWADTLDKAGLLRPGTRRDVLTNELVLIRPLGGAVGRLVDLGSEKLALADPDSVPAGRYAKASLQASGELAGVASKIVPAENVRAALALVERGEAALGIVYATDAKPPAKVEILATLPPASHPPIRYPVAVLTKSRHPDAAAFAQFLSSAQAQAIFRKHGFGIPL